MKVVFIQRMAPLLVASLVFGATACIVDGAPLDEQGASTKALENEAAPQDPRVDPAELGPVGGVLVSPELFDLSARWSAEAAKEDGPEGLDLEAYAQIHAPELVFEAREAMRRAKPERPTGPLAAMASNTPCACKVWGTYDKLGANLTSGNWYVNTRGAAHDGRIHQIGSHNLKENTTNGAVYKTQFKMRMNCVSIASGAPCTAGCSGKLYADVRYATQLAAGAKTGGVWAKGSTGQVVDAVTLDLRTPWGGAGTRLFEKGASISHFASTTTFDVNSLATLVKSSVNITLAITTGDLSFIGPKLVNDTIDAIFGLVHRDGANGTTSEGMIIDYETAFAQPINVSYSSALDQYYALDLSSSVRMKTRGYGGSHEAWAQTSSGYSMATYVSNFVCDPGVSPPPVTGFWRYDTYDGAPITAAAAQDRIKNFFYLVYGVWVNPSINEGSLEPGVCGDNICSALETDFTCPGDCVRCGDKKCSQGESASSCPGDCSVCGDGSCTGSETLISCPADCGYCGDGFCAGTESCFTCDLDCGLCGPCPKGQICELE